MTSAAGGLRGNRRRRSSASDLTAYDRGRLRAYRDGLREAGHDLLIDKLSAATRAGIGAPILVETAIVLSARLRRDARGTVARMLQELGIEIIPFADTHYGIVVNAWLSVREYERGEYERQVLRALARGEQEISAGAGYDLNSVFEKPMPC